MTYLLYLLWGGAIGVVSGVVGLGGGFLIVPTLVYLFGLSQHQAQGTSLALMIPPSGLLAAMRYWNNGHVVLPIAVCGALGFFLGGYFGAGLAQNLDEIVLKRVFGTSLVLIGLKMLFDTMGR